MFLNRVGLAGEYKLPRGFLSFRACSEAGPIQLGFLVPADVVVNSIVVVHRALPRGMKFVLRWELPDCITRSVRYRTGT